MTRRTTRKASSFKGLHRAWPHPSLLVYPNKPTFTVAHASNAYLRIMDVARHVVEGRPIFEIASLDGLRGALQRVMSTGHTVTMPAQSFVITGAARGVDIYQWCPRYVPITDDAGHLAYILLELEDAVEPQQALFRSQRRLQHLVESTPFAVAMLDRRMRYLYVSRRWLVDFKVPFTTEQIRGRSHYEVFPETPQRWREIHARCLSGECIKNDVGRISRMDGNDQWLRCEVCPWTDDDGNIGGILIFCEDVTIAKRAEEELRRAVAIRDEFLCIASHELRTPLTALLLHIQSLQRLMRQPEQVPVARARRKLDVAIKQAKSLGTLVEELLDITQLDGRQASLHLEEFEMGDLIQDVTNRLNELSAQAKCDFHLNLSNGSRGTWDRTKLEQVLMNVLANAIKYGRGAPVEVDLATKPDTIEIRVRDHGIGISYADQKRIFERFERAVPTRHYGGLGLGLFVARELTTLHHGEIMVESTPHKGATFTIRLPRSCAVHH